MASVITIDRPDAVALISQAGAKPTGRDKSEAATTPTTPRDKFPRLHDYRREVAALWSCMLVGVSDGDPRARRSLERWE
jgi:hypothetical protein